MIKIDDGFSKSAIYKRLMEMPLNYHNMARQSLYSIGKEMEKVVKDGIKNPPKTGRTYRYRGRRYRASAPGQYPANRSGNLRRSVEFNVEGKKFVKVGTDVEYGRFLEDGTRRMARRPFLELSRKKIGNRIPTICAQRIEKYINVNL